MKRIVLIAVLVLFTASILFFHFFGGEMRLLFAMEVTCFPAAYGQFEDSMVLTFPAEALYRDKTGSAWVWRAVEVEGNLCTAQRTEVEVMGEQDGFIYIEGALILSPDVLQAGDHVITDAPRTPENGDMIRIAG